MENGSEKLFLLEFLVDQVSVQKPGGLMDRLSTQNEWGCGELCVTFQFLDYPHLEICEQDFVSKMNDTAITKTSFRSGKSCLFAIPNTQLELLPQEFEVNVGVLRKMPPGVLPDKLLLAQTKIELTEAITGVIDEVTRNPQDVPVTKKVRETFSLMEPTGLKVIGCIGVFVRLTCFGKLIVTPFHLGGGCDGGASTFFGGSEDNPEVYHCTEVGAGPRTCAPQPLPVCQPTPACQWPTWTEPCQDAPCCGDIPPPCCKELKPIPAPPPAAGGGGGGGECLCAAEPCCPAPCSTSPRRKPKPCKEIGAEINGHALTIRVRKNKDLENECMADTGDSCCAISVPSSCPCSSDSCPGGPGFFVQLPQKDGKPVSYNLRNCLAEDTGGDCLEQTDKPRDNFVLRIGKGKSHLELELKTPKKEGPRPLTETSSRETQYVAAEAGPPINFYIPKRCRGKRGKK